MTRNDKARLGTQDNIFSH